ncbi:MAG: hypothetical protein RI885_911 [Actinomycetota bacterium]
MSTHERFDVTRNGKRAAVLLSADDYDALVETVDILGDVDLVDDLRRGSVEVQSGLTSSADEVRAALIARGRLPA